MSAQPIYGPMREPVDLPPVAPPIVRDTATVTVSDAVDGTRKRTRKAANPKRGKVRRTRTKTEATTHTEIKVVPEVMAAAREALAATKDSRLVIVSETEVRIINRSNYTRTEK